MNTERCIEVSGIPVDVVRKDIKNLHVAVYPPLGRVRVAAPVWLDDEAVRVAVVSRLSWIRRQRRRFEQQVRQSSREMVTGESHYFQGRRYRLDVQERAGNPKVEVLGNRTLKLMVPSGTDTAARQRLLERWYRRRLSSQLPPMVQYWEGVVGVRVAEWRIKRMKTRWGSCNAEARRVWLNLELAKKPSRCLEYVLVHEMVHILERNHTQRFQKLMDRAMPDWRRRRDELNRAPLAHEDWQY